MNKKELFAIIFILVSFNIWLLISNNEGKKEIDSLITEIQSSDANLEAESWGFEHAGNKIAKLSHSEINLNTNGIILSVYFTDHGCSFCIKNNIEHLNILWKKYPHKIQVFLIGYNESFLKRLYNTNFPYTLINPEEKLLDNDFTFDNPVAIISDQKNIVQLINIAEKNNETKSNQFFQKIDSLLESI